MGKSKKASKVAAARKAAETRKANAAKKAIDVQKALDKQKALKAEMMQAAKENKAAAALNNEPNNDALDSDSEFEFELVEIPKKIELEGKKIPMNENLLWRFIKVDGKYVPAEEADYVFYENGVILLRVHDNYFEVTVEAGEIYVTQRKKYKQLVKTWKEKGTNPVSFIDIIPRHNETDLEALRRALPEDLYEQARQLPPGVTQDVF